MEKLLLKRCLLLSAVLHLLLTGIFLFRIHQAGPQAVGAVEVTLLPLPEATIGDGRAPGRAGGSLKPAGRPAGAPYASPGKPLPEDRSRVRAPRILPPHRDVTARRFATRLHPGRHNAKPNTAVPQRIAANPAPPRAERAPSMPVEAGMRLAALCPAPSAIPPETGDPAGRPAASTIAAALGIPDAPDAPLDETPAPDFDFGARRMQAGVPGAATLTGAGGTGTAAGDRGTGGARSNRGYLAPGVLGAYYADPPRKAGDYPLNTPFAFPIHTRFVLQRIDPAINFIWDMKPPAPGVPSTYFSVRWTGKLLVPTTDLYTFYIERLDDGARLYLDGKMVAESWLIQQGIAVIRTVPLTAGVHDFRLDYCQGPETHASVRLAWSSAQFGKEIIRARAPRARSARIAGLARK